MSTSQFQSKIKIFKRKKNTPKPISINVFQKFQAIIKRILEQTKKPQAVACGLV